MDEWSHAITHAYYIYTCLALIILDIYIYNIIHAKLIHNIIFVLYCLVPLLIAYTYVLLYKVNR